MYGLIILKQHIVVKKMTDKYKMAKELADKIDFDIIETFKIGKNFKVEAGAGSGKTHSLMKVLSWIKDNCYSDFVKKGQKIACITYTNAAVNVISERLGEESFIVPSTIHSFAWEVIKKYQDELIKYILENNIFPKDFNPEKDLINKVCYDLGIKYFADGILYLFHNDVLELFSHMLDINKFRTLLASQYPVIFIDEYQDSNEKIIRKFIKYFIEQKAIPSIQFGFFGDSWQTIYKTNNAVGNIFSENIVNINKKVNFRSSPEIIKCLNNIRPDLKQESALEEGNGIVRVVHCNDYDGVMRVDRNFIGDLPSSEIKIRLDKIIDTLGNVKSTKVLMLTHKILASQQDYSDIYEKFGSSFKDNDDELIEFVCNVLCPIVDSLKNNDAKKLFETLGSTRPPVLSQKHKLMWKDLNKKLQDNIGNNIVEMIKIIYESKLVPMSDEIINIYQNMLNNPLDKYNNKSTYYDISQIKYSEFEKLASFLNPDSIFSTDHGVKGEEYDNVIFVIGKGWNLYDFEKVLPMNDIAQKQNIDAYERTRNLFYVGCSRPRKKLILLITCELKGDFYKYLSSIFGENNILSYSEYII